MRQLLQAGFYAAWVILLFVWIGGWLRGVKPVAYRLPRSARLALFAPVLIVLLLFSLHLLPEEWMVRSLWPTPPGVRLLGLAFTWLGCGFAIWARLTLGANWSGLPQIKQEHELIVRGPYASARHPIYTGILLAILGAVLAVGRGHWVLIWVLCAAVLLVKAYQEEALLRDTFPDEYPQYAKRVKALIPWVL